MVNRRTGVPRFADAAAMRSTFGIAPETAVLLTGTDRDPPLERWWGLGETARRSIIRSLRNAGVVMTTTPNYSLFLDRPRWDDLHSMKRIAIVHSEFLSEGLPAALHVNGRTDADFRRWTDYVRMRPEVTHLAYEFTTGTGAAERREKHVSWLVELARSIDHPLHLIIRGAAELLPSLNTAFANVTFLDTSVFMKTMKRQRAFCKDDGGISWLASPTIAGAPLDDLFAENSEMRARWITAFLGSVPRVGRTIPA
jgi:hypothetical protein